jgi:hypothetical protein
MTALPLLVLTTTSTASAQGWLSDRRLAEGPGIRTGDLELHPGIAGEAGYDSNWFLRSHVQNPPGQPQVLNGPPGFAPTDAAVFRVTPQFYVSTLGQERVLNEGTARVEPRFITFRGGVSATARFFIGKEMSDQHNVSVDADARVDFNAGHPVAAGVFAGYDRLIQPQVFGNPDLSFNRDDIRAGADVTVMPGGGSLDIRGGYQLRTSIYEESQGVPYGSITHDISVKNRWRFRPRTALFSEADLLFTSYPNAPRASLYLNDSTPLRTRFGISGLMTDWFGILVAAGYSGTFFKDPNAPSTTQYDSVNGQAEGTFYVGGTGGADEPGKSTLLLSTVSLGVSRDFQTSLLGNFYTDDRAYAKVEYWFGGRAVLRLTGYADMLDYPQVFLNNGGGAIVPATPGGFTNWRVGGEFFAEYRFSQVFGINTTIDYVQEISDTQLPAGQAPGAPAGTIGLYDLNYRRFQAFLGARYFY